MYQYVFYSPILVLTPNIQERLGSKLIYYQNYEQTRLLGHILDLYCSNTIQVYFFSLMQLLAFLAL